MCAVVSFSGWMALAGCCLETTGTETATGTGIATGSGTGRATGTTSGSSTGGSSTGAPNGPFFGEIEAETLTTFEPGSDAGGSVSFFAARFLPSNTWPDCRSDQNPSVAAGSCCFAPPTTSPGLSAGTLHAIVAIDDGGPQGPEVAFDEDGGVYLSTFQNSPGSASLAGASATGDVVPAFTASGFLFQGNAPVLTPDLGEMTTLSTRQDWTVPLTPSEFEFEFQDRVIVDSEDVGRIICETDDEGVLRPALVVPASLLGPFSGHTGTVTIYRDDYDLVDAGAVVLGIRLGSGIRTAANAVSFTP